MVFTCVLVRFSCQPDRLESSGKGSFERLPASACLYSVGHFRIVSGWGVAASSRGTALGQAVIKQAEQALEASSTWNFSLGFCFKSSG